MRTETVGEIIAALVCCGVGIALILVIGILI
jgi:hypothetical protein